MRRVCGVLSCCSVRCRAPGCSRCSDGGGSLCGPQSSAGLRREHRRSGGFLYSLFLFSFFLSSFLFFNRCFILNFGPLQHFFSFHLNFNSPPKVRNYIYQIEILIKERKGDDGEWNHPSKEKKRCRSWIEIKSAGRNLGI